LNALSGPAAPPVAARPARAATWIVLAVALASVAVGAALHGAVDIPLRDAFDMLAGGGGAGGLGRAVLLDLRVPRVLLAMLTGAALALAGAAMQALFRNPLAEPGLVGISAGGALGAAAAIVLVGGSLWARAPAAFVGSLLATLLAYGLGRRYPGTAGLLLAGVAINAVAASAIGLLTYVAGDARLRDLAFWNMGSLADAGWPMLAGLAAWTLPLAAVLLTQWRGMNALLLGEREASHLGFDLAVLRRLLVGVVALMIGPLTAATGGIAFVGLIVPHVLRMVLGADHRALLPASLLGGALALTLADWLSRVAIAPAELPIGLVTSLVGGPFFLWLLARGRRF